MVICRGCSFALEYGETRYLAAQSATTVGLEAHNRLACCFACFKVHTPTELLVRLVWELLSEVLLLFTVTYQSLSFLFKCLRSFLLNGNHYELIIVLQPPPPLIHPPTDSKARTPEQKGANLISQQLGYQLESWTLWRHLGWLVHWSPN